MVLVLCYLTFNPDRVGSTIGFVTNSTKTAFAATTSTISPGDITSNTFRYGAREGITDFPDYLICGKYGQLPLVQSTIYASMRIARA